VLGAPAPMRRIENKLRRHFHYPGLAAPSVSGDDYSTTKPAAGQGCDGS
jgi:hypothetical protein